MQSSRPYALTIGAMVVLMVHRAFGSTVDLTMRLDDERIVHQRRMRMQLELDELIASLDVGTPSGARFDGSPSEIVFQTTGTPGRRTLEVRNAWLQVRRGRHLDSLIPASTVAFDYLLDYGARESWVQSWHSPASTPLAIRVRVRSAEGDRTDTLLLIVGPRG